MAAEKKSISLPFPCYKIVEIMSSLLDVLTFKMHLIQVIRSKSNTFEVQWKVPLFLELCGFQGKAVGTSPFASFWKITNYFYEVNDNLFGMCKWELI